MDKFKNHLKTIDSVCENAFVIVPNDDNDLPNASRSIYVGSGGNLKVLLVNSNAPIVLKNVQDGSVLPLRIKKVFAIDTSADDLIALL
jgi:hypothetical protein